jgi:hypothetical protein
VVEPQCGGVPDATAQRIVRDFLRADPQSTEDRICDAMVRPPDPTTGFHGVAQAEQILTWPTRRWFERRLGSGSKETGAESMRSGGLMVAMFGREGHASAPGVAGRANLTRQGRAPIAGASPLRSVVATPPVPASRNQTGKVVAAHFFQRSAKATDALAPSPSGRGLG